MMAQAFSKGLQLRKSHLIVLVIGCENPSWGFSGLKSYTSLIPSSLHKTISAKNRSPFCWFERNFAFLSAVRTNCFVHFSVLKAKPVEILFVAEISVSFHLNLLFLKIY